MKRAAGRLGGWASGGLIGALLLLPAGPPDRLRAQGWSVAGWAGYEGVTDADDWFAAGGQVRLVSRRGDGVWVAGERLERFGTRDVTARMGGVVHPASRWWLSAEAASALDPEFAPKNAWEADVSVLVARRVSAGVGYRRQNYVVGPVHVLLPHLTVEARGMSWDVRGFVSRNPTERTDAAVFVRATTPLGRRAVAWLGAGAGRESYLVVDPLGSQSVRSLETITGVVGTRYNVGGGTTVRLEATVVRSTPVLSRRGVWGGLERSF